MGIDCFCRAEELGYFACSKHIRALAWPTVLVGWVAQSASLGMKDSWGPLKALAVASAVNGIGDIVLCIFLGLWHCWGSMGNNVITSRCCLYDDRSTEQKGIQWIYLLCSILE
uniref:Uncharacterized protein n=1 Tax=Salix viminalis TaxID=40686 RepID=A0A6N2MUX9_SALVM